MQAVSEILKVKPSGSTEQPQRPCKHSQAVWIKTWRALQSAGLISKDLLPNGPDCNYWKKSCEEFTDEQLKQAVEKSKDFTGYFLLGDLRELCSQDPDKMLAPYHKPFAPRLEQKKASEETRAKHLAELRELFRG